MIKDLLLFFLPAFIFFATMFVSFIYSLKEKEERAASVSFVGMLLLPVPFIALYFSDIAIKEILVIILDATIIILSGILFLPQFKKKISVIIDTPTTQFDERDVILHRRALFGKQYDEYYERRPEKLEPDELWRAESGLLSKTSHYYNQLQFKASEANFVAAELLIRLAKTMKPVKDRATYTSDKLTPFLKRYMKNIGAYDYGFTELQKYHLYSISGKHSDYGKTITNNHQYAIAIIVEMDKEMLDYAPAGPTVMETSHEYYKVGGIALRVAQFLNQLGYSAKANIDAYYEVICPLVGRDAGLGEIGRMGLLMHPKLGPRHRIAVVTTDAPLNVSVRKPDYSMIEFCTVCKKCSDVCPSKAIPTGAMKKDENGVTRWQIDAEKCFQFWCYTGTDCGRCIKACPYSHPSNMFHDSIRLAIKKAPRFRKIASAMDDIFYGRVPSVRPVDDDLK